MKKIRTKASNQLRKAIEIAVSAHEGQLDKSGVPYICHPIRVSSLCENYKAKCVAMLHDVIEDCNILDKDLLNVGVDPDIVEAVKILTKSPQDYEKYEEYILHIITSGNVSAIEVKLYDLYDNLGKGRAFPNPLSRNQHRMYKAAYDLIAEAWFNLNMEKKSNGTECR